jgi:hypothetical protein
LSPLIALLAGCDAPYPEAFHYQIDRTLVVGIQAYQRGDGSWLYDALVVSPWEVQSVDAEICGLRTDVQVYVDARCFGEPALIEQVSRGMPGTFTLPALAYDCEPTASTGSSDSGGSGYIGSYGYGYFPGPCDSQVPLRIVARSTEDRGSAFIPLILGDSLQRPTLDPRLADPRLELLAGEPEAGGEVRLGFTLPVDWFGHDSPAGLHYRWYVDEGELLGTGRTATTRTTAQRFVAENTLRIPEDYHGPLQVAVVAELAPPVWQTLTLEVP